jgi:hypothetical protein
MSPCKSKCWHKCAVPLNEVDYLSPIRTKYSQQ